MADYLAQLEDLKSVVQTSTDFSVAWNQFFDLTEQVGFVKASRPSRLDHLAAAIDAIGGATKGRTRRVFKPPVITRYADSDFYHGTVDSSRCMGAFMYFKSLDLGMLALTHARSSETTFFRFSLALVDGKSIVVLPEPGSGDPAIH